MVLTSGESGFGRIFVNISDSELYVREIETPHYLLDVRYDGDINKAVLVFLSEDGRSIKLLPDPTGHKPYFITVENPVNIANNKEFASDKGFVKVDVVEKIDPISMKKMKLTKIVTQTPTDVARLRSRVSKAYEAHIKYHNNYVYDNLLIPGMKYVVKQINRDVFKLVKPSVSDDTIAEIKKLFGDLDSKSMNSILEEWIYLFEEKPPKALKLSIDIEVQTPFRGRVPSAKQAQYPVISVAMVSNDGLKKVLVLARENMWGEVHEDYPFEAVIEIFDNEKSLIMEVFETIKKHPVIVTYNGDAFDLPYLYTRALRLGISREHIPIQIGENIARVKTGVHIDLYKFFKNRSIKAYAFGGKYQEETLDAVSLALLGVGKLKYIESPSEMSITKLVTYNYRDALITLQLLDFSDELVWKLMILLARITKTGLEEICRKTISKWIQNMIYWEHRKLNYLIPEKEDILKYAKQSATQAVIDGKKYAGALVIEPIKGILFRVVVLDIASLYPSVIKSFNLSYETVDTPFCNGRKLDIVDETGRKLHEVCLDKQGLSSRIVGLLRDLRVGVYKKKAKRKDLVKEQIVWYDIVQRALKVLINASYGVFGSSSFPLYSPAVAESVTAIGRRILYSLLRKSADIGIKVVYGDTDSLFLWNPTEQQLIKLQEWVSKSFGLEIEIDKTFTFVLFSGLKKNYLGRTTNGDVEIKGLLAKKRNIPEFLKFVFEDILERIKSIEAPEDFVKFKVWLEDEVRKLYVSLKRKEITLDKLCFKVGLTKKPEEYVKVTPPHIKAALQLKNYFQVQEGDIIPYVKIRGRDGYKALQLAKLYEIDPDKYVEIIHSTLSQLLSALGISKEEIIGIKRLN
ncbi:MAG: DNA-directed DNA polymerase I [Desulfurococcaceae archaeon]